MCFCIAQGVSDFNSSFLPGPSYFGIIIVVEKKFFSMINNVDRLISFQQETSFSYMLGTPTREKANSCIVCRNPPLKVALCLFNGNQQGEMGSLIFC